MTTSSQLRSLVVALCGLMLVSLVINMNVAFNVREAVRPSKIAVLVREEIGLMVKNMIKTQQHDEKVIQKLEPRVLPQGHTTGSLIDTSDSGSNPSYNDSLNEAPFLFHKNFTPSFTLGKGRSESVSVVIGIPSVKRPDTSYLENSLQSLFDNMYPANEESVSFVVFLAETDAAYTKAQMQKLYDLFPYEVDSGLLQVISPPVDFYPAFDVLPRTLGDPPERIKWRSKEVVDAAYLMFVCRNKAEYYLMAEDDIAALRGYMSYIKEFVKQKERDNYIYLSLARFNSIGKLFRASTIPKWTSYLMTFYGNKPVDWLMSDYVNIMSCHPEMKSSDCQTRIAQMKPQFQLGLFQHVGKQSSFPGKTQSILDSKFTSQSTHPNPHKNPEAQVTTSYQASDDSSAESLYVDSGGMNQHFLASESKENDHLTVTFKTRVKISKIVVKTGNGDDKLCDNCAVIEILSHADVDYKLCSDTASRGTLFCRPNLLLEGFRVRNTQDVSHPVYFKTLFVQTVS